MNASVAHEVNSFRDFEAAYVTPLVDALHEGFDYVQSDVDLAETYAMEYTDAIITASDNLDKAVTAYTEAYKKAFGNSFEFEDALSRLIIRDICERPYGDYSFNLRDMGDDYHGYTQAVIDDFAKYMTDRGVIKTRIIDDLTESDANNWLLLDNDDISYLRDTSCSPKNVNVDAVEFGNRFEDIRGNSWQSCRVYYAYEDGSHYYDQGGYKIVETILSEGCVGMAIPVLNESQLAINDSKLVFDVPNCAHELDLDLHQDLEFGLSAEYRRNHAFSEAESRLGLHRDWEGECTCQPVKDEDYEYELEHGYIPANAKFLRKVADASFNQFRLGHFAPDFFDSNGMHYMTTSKDVEAKQQLSVDTLDTLIERLRSRSMAYDYADEIDSIDWAKLNEYVSVSIKESAIDTASLQDTVSDLQAFVNNQSAVVQDEDDGIRVSL